MRDKSKRRGPLGFSKRHFMAEARSKCVLKSPSALPAGMSLADAIALVARTVESRETRRALCGRLVPVWEQTLDSETARAAGLAGEKPGPCTACAMLAMAKVPS